MAGLFHSLGPACLLLAVSAGAGFTATLDCRTEALCEGGTDCEAPGDDALKLRLTGFGSAETALERDGAPLAVSQSRPAPLWRWSATSQEGQIEVMAFRESDKAFTYLILEGGRTALKASGHCEVQ